MSKIKIFLITALFIPFFYSCHFGAQGTGVGSTDLGGTCLIAALRFIPTPSSISGGSSSSPALPFSGDDCSEWGNSLNANWIIERTDLTSSNSSASNPIETSQPTTIDIIHEDGRTYCVLAVSIPSQTINSIGMGRWQVTHNLGDWSVTCDEEEITQCPTANQDAALLVSHATHNINECIQDKLLSGDLIDGAEVDYP